MTLPYAEEAPTRQPERMWPLDLGLLAAGGVVGYIVLTKLRFDDPRPFHNAGVYLGLIGTGIVLLSLLSRYVAARYFERSAQLGFLASIVLHLTMVSMAVNVIVFGKYFPENSGKLGSQREREPRTVPDHLFSRAAKSSQPDWAKPVPAEASSEAESMRRAEITPQPQSAANLEFVERETPQPEQPQDLATRAAPAANLPEPQDEPEALSQARSTPPPAIPEIDLPPSIAIPELPNRPAIEPEAAERMSATQSAPDRAAPSPAIAASLDLPDTPSIPDRSAAVALDRPQVKSPPRPPQETLPTVTPLNEPRPTDRPPLSRRPLDALGMTPEMPNLPSAGARSSVPSDTPAPRAELAPSRSDSMSLNRPSAAPATTPPTDINLPTDIGPRVATGGIGQSPLARPSIGSLAQMQPRIGDVASRPDPKSRLGGNSGLKPSADQITIPEVFRRRTLRNSEGGVPGAASETGPETEDAIERGLKFLAAQQTADGRWTLQSPGEEVALRSDTAATGLSLLAFQGAGYTHREHRYAPVLAKGIRAMLAMQQPDGNLFRSEDAYSNQSVALYSHGIASLAICEAYGMTGDPALREPAQRAIDYIVQTQHRQRGGWRYQPQVSSDTSVSGWMMMALKSGELAGLSVPASTYEGVDRWLDFAQLSPERGDLYRYNPFAPNTAAQGHGREVTPSMTAVAILMRMYSGWGRDNTNMRQAAAYLLKNPPRIGDASSPARDTYYWYYATQVMFHMGGQWWQDWNGQLKPILLNAQVKSGPNEGSWDPAGPVPDRWAIQAGRLYLTTLNLLSLEVFYRHLPIYENTAK